MKENVDESRERWKAFLEEHGYIATHRMVRVCERGSTDVMMRRRCEWSGAHAIRAITKCEPLGEEKTRKGRGDLGGGERLCREYAGGAARPSMDPRRDVHIRDAHSMGRVCGARRAESWAH